MNSLTLRDSPPTGSSPLPIEATEAAVAQHLARARLCAAEKIREALEHDEPLAPGLHKLCIDALKLPLDRSAQSPLSLDITAVAPELRDALHRVLEEAGAAFRSATTPDHAGARAPHPNGGRP